MPPEDKPANKPMTSVELGLLKLWINEGAVDDSEESAVRNEARKSIVLGELPPGVQPINAVDMTASGMRVAAGRANVVQVYDVDSGLEIVSLGGHKDLINQCGIALTPGIWLLAATRSSRSGTRGRREPCTRAWQATWDRLVALRRGGGADCIFRWPGQEHSGLEPCGRQVALHFDWAGTRDVLAVVDGGKTLVLGVAMGRSGGWMGPMAGSDFH